MRVAWLSGLAVVVVQAAGIAVPAIAVLLARGAICARWILVGVIGFVVARLLGAAGAAACALRGLMRA